MFRKIILIFIVICVLIVSITITGAYILKQNSNKNNTLISEESNYLKIDTDKDIYEFNEIVNISIILVNGQNDKVTYVQNTDFNLFIYGPHNETVFHYPDSDVDGISIITIKAKSELLISQFHWDIHLKENINGKYLIYIALYDYPMIHGEKEITIRN